MTPDFDTTSNEVQKRLRVPAPPPATPPSLPWQVAPRQAADESGTGRGTLTGGDVCDDAQDGARYRLAGKSEDDGVEVEPLHQPEAGLEVDAANHEARLHRRDRQLAQQRLVVSEAPCGV